MPPKQDPKTQRERVEPKHEDARVVVGQVQEIHLDARQRVRPSQSSDPPARRPDLVDDTFSHADLPIPSGTGPAPAVAARRLRTAVCAVHGSRKSKTVLGKKALCEMWP